MLGVNVWVDWVGQCLLWLYGVRVSVSVLLGTGLVVAVVYVLLRSYSQVKIWCHPTQTNLAIVRGLSTLRRGRWRVPFWVTSGHLQTIFTPLVKPSPHPDYSRILLQNPNCGGTIVCDIHDNTTVFERRARFNFPFITLFSDHSLHPPSSARGYHQLRPLVFIVPGISSNRSSAYIRSAVHALGVDGCKVVIVNHRGGEFEAPQLSSAQIFTVGGSTDLRTAIEHFRNEEAPGTPFVLVGFSLGGNICVNYTSEYEDVGTELVGCVSICQGYDGRHGVEILEKDQPFYSRVLLNKLQRIVQQHEAVFRNHPKISWEAVMAARTVPEFDTAFSAPLHGYASADDYYTHHSCITRIGRARVPLLLINSTDDPFIPADLFNLSIQAAKNQTNIIAVHTSKGGHLGFWEGGLFRPYSKSWIDRLLCEFAALMSVLGPGAIFRSEDPVMSPLRQ